MWGVSWPLMKSFLVLQVTTLLYNYRNFCNSHLEWKTKQLNGPGNYWPGISRNGLQIGEVVILFWGCTVKTNHRGLSSLAFFQFFVYRVVGHICIRCIENHKINLGKSYAKIAFVWSYVAEISTGQWMKYFHRQFRSYSFQNLIIYYLDQFFFWNTKVRLE